MTNLVTELFNPQTIGVEVRPLPVGRPTRVKDYKPTIVAELMDLCEQRVVNYHWFARVGRVHLVAYIPLYRSDPVVPVVTEVNWSWLDRFWYKTYYSFLEHDLMTLMSGYRAVPKSQNRLRKIVKILTKYLDEAELRFYWENMQLAINDPNRYDLTKNNRELEPQ